MIAYLTCPSGAVVVAVPKVAQTSLIGSIGGQSLRADHSGRVIVFIREPLERLESCFHFFHTRGRGPAGSPPVASLEALVDRILDEGDLNEHWAPQTTLWGVQPTEIYAFEDIGRVMREEGVNLKHKNATRSPKSGIEYRRGELEALFALDLSIYEKVAPKSWR